MKKAFINLTCKYFMASAPDPELADNLARLIKTGGPYWSAVSSYLNSPTENGVREKNHRANDLHPVVEREASRAVCVHHQVIQIFVLRKQQSFFFKLICKIKRDLKTNPNYQ